MIIRTAIIALICAIGISACSDPKLNRSDVERLVNEAYGETAIVVPYSLTEFYCTDMLRLNCPAHEINLQDYGRILMQLGVEEGYWSVITRKIFASETGKRVTNVNWDLPDLRRSERDGEEFVELFVFEWKLGEVLGIRETDGQRIELNGRSCDAVAQIVWNRQSVGRVGARYAEEIRNRADLCFQKFDDGWRLITSHSEPGSIDDRWWLAAD